MIDSHLLGIALVEDILPWIAVASLAAGMVYSLLVHQILGIGWLDADTGHFAELIARGSVFANLIELGALGAALGLARQAFEALAQLLARSGVY